MSFSLYNFVEVLKCSVAPELMMDPGGGGEEDSSAFFIETFAFTSDAKALVVAAVSSCHELIFVHGCSDNPSDLKSIKFPWCHDPEKRIACVALSPSGRWLACVLENGSIEIVPTKLALGDISTTKSDPGINPLFSEEEFTLIHLSVRNDGLGLPTCAVWYETKNRRPMLFYSNKGGDILVVDMMLRKLAVSLQAPQSIHNMEIVQDAALTDIYLLVTGFAGTQWMVPLEQGDLSMRETLANIIPSELKEVGNTEESFVFSVESRGTKCVGVLKPDLNRFQIFNTVSLVNPALDVGLPSSTSLVHYADSVTFSLKNQCEIVAALNMSSAMDQHSKAAQKFTQSISTLAEGSRFLGFVPLKFRLRPQVIEVGISRKLSILTTYVDTGLSPRMKMMKQFSSLMGTSFDRSDECLPGCFLVTDSGIFTLLPACGGDDLFLSCLIPTFNLSAAESLCMTLELDFRRTVYAVVPRILADRSMEPEITMKLCEASEMPIADVVRVFCSHGHHSFILPHLEAWLLQRRVMTDMAREELSKLAFDMHMRMVSEAQEYERHVKEHSFRDFLLHNPWYPTETCLEELIHKKLWSCASVLLKVHDLSETAVRELLALSPADWETTDSFVELLTLPNHARLFTNRWDLADEFLTQLETFAASWKEKRHLKNLLALTNPQRPEIQILLKLEESNTSRAEFAAARTLTSQIANLFLKTLVKYVYMTPTMGARIASSSCLTRSGNFTPGVSQPQQQKFGDDLPPVTVSSQKPPEMTVTVPGNCRPLACGSVHSCLVTSDGLFCWGKCKDGLLGNENMGNTQTIFPDVKGPLLSQEEAPIGKSSLPVMVIWPYPSLSVLSVVCGAEHTLIMTEVGEVFGWGQNRLGQLGMGDRVTRRKPENLPFFAAESGNVFMPEVIASGQYHCAVIDSKNDVYMWGWGVHGQLGLGRSVDDELSPRRVRYFQDRSIEINNVALGYAHTIFLTERGEVYVSGNGVYGQLGLPTTKKRSVPERLDLEGLNGVSHVAAGHFHNVALTTDGRLWTWGATPQSLKFKALLQKRKQSAESKGDRNNGGGLGNLQNEGLAAIEGKHLRPTEIDLSQAILKSERITQLECGFHHSAILTESGQLYTWGKNLEFQLGHGDKKERPTPTLVTSVGDGKQWRFVACGSEYTMAVDKQGLIWGWGRNDIGQMGFESLSEAERHRLGGKVLMIQSKNKNQRTITLPQDGRSFVSKPTRLVGLSVGPGSQPSDQEMEHRQIYDEEVLIESLRSFQGRFQTSDIAEKCVGAGALDVASFVWLLEGNIIEALKSHCAAIRLRNAGRDEVGKILDFYGPYFRVVDNQSVLRGIVELLNLELNLHKEEVEKMFLSNLELWGRPISSLLRSEPGTLTGLSSELKLKSLMYQIETGAVDSGKEETESRGFTEISQEIIQDTVRFGDKYCYVFNCGHILSEGTVQSQLSDLKAIERVNSSFPHTAALVQKYFSVDKENENVKIKSPLCPNCVGSKLLQLAETVVV